MNHRLALAALLGGEWLAAQQPARVDVSSPVSRLIAGERIQLTAVARNNTGGVMQSTITWVSNNTGVLEVDAQGMVTARNLGGATVTARSGNAQSALLLAVYPLRIDIAPAGLQNLTVGETIEFRATPVDIRGEPVSFRVNNWEVTGANGGQINAAGIDTNGNFRALGVGRVTVRALINYGQGPVNWIWGTTHVNILPARHYKLRRLMGSEDVGHSFLMRPALLGPMAANDNGQIAFVASLDGLTSALLLYEQGQIRLLAAGGQRGATDGLIDTPTAPAINQAGQVATQYNVARGSQTMAVYSAGEVSYPLLGNTTQGFMEQIGTFGLGRHAINELGEIALRLNFTRQGTNQRPFGVAKLTRGVLDLIADQDTRLPGLAGRVDFENPGIDNEGTVYFIAYTPVQARESALYRRQGFSAPLKILGSGDAFEGGRVRSVQNLAVLGNGTIAYMVGLENGPGRLVRQTGDQRVSIPVNWSGHISQSGAGRGLLFVGDGGQGTGMYRWQGATVTRLLTQNGLAPNGEPIRSIDSAHETAKGEVLVQLTTVERGFAVIQLGSPNRTLFQAGDRVEVTAGLQFSFRNALGYSRTGSIYFRFGNPAGLFEWQDGVLQPRLLPGETLPDGGQYSNLRDASVSPEGDLYFRDNRSSAIYRLAEGRIEVAVPHQIRAEDGTLLSLGGPDQLATGANGQVIFAARGGDGRQRYYLFQNGRLTLLWRDDQTGEAFRPSSQVAIDDQGRVLAMYSIGRLPPNQGALSVWENGAWRQVAVAGQTQVAGLVASSFGSLRAAGGRLFASFTVRGGDAVLAEYVDGGWRPLMVPDTVMPDGSQLRNFGFEVNPQGDVLIMQFTPVNLLRDGALVPVYSSFLGTDDGNRMVGWSESFMGPEGRIVLGGADLQGRWQIYEAEPVSR